MDVHDSIQQAKKAASQDDIATAQKILKQVISEEPKNVEAWLILADIVKKPEVAERCLQQVLKIDPGNQVAQQKLQRFQSLNPNTVTQEQKPAAAPQLLEERLQNVAQPSMELDDPWDVPGQPSSPARPTSPVAAARSMADLQIRSAKPESRKPKRSGRWLEFSLIGVLALMAVCVLGLFLFLPNDASGEQDGPAAEAASSDDDPRAIIFANIDASNAESIPHYMATIHSKSPSYQTTKEMTEQAFGMFDLSYKVSGLKITKQTKNEAVVAFTLTTQKIRGPSFRDNRISGDMILRKEDGRWKIYNQVVNDVKYLN